jgi:DNA-binding LacI/PurR family transcriptional regulator
VAEFLLAGGHRRLGYIAGWAGASTQRGREAGFTEALAAAGSRLSARETGDFDAAKARGAARAMFGVRDRPDAVFVANDHMAFQVMDVLRSELGIAVPGDVSVVGFDDVPPAAWAAYDLTTVRQRANLMVEKTVAVLLAQIEDPKTPPRQIRIDAPLVVRGSARVPEGWAA